MRGKMKRCTLNNASPPVIECTSVDIQLFLFDHCLVFCKIKHQDGLDYYKIYQKVNYSIWTYFQKKRKSKNLL
jgi:hypothetical protein